MLEIAEAKYQFGHIRVYILTALGNAAVESPRCGIARQQRQHRTVATRRIEQRLEQPLE